MLYVVTVIFLHNFFYADAINSATVLTGEPCLTEPFGSLGSSVSRGPFKCTPVRVGPCANPPLPLDPDPAALFNAEIVNLTKNIKVIRFNVTVLRESSSKQLKVKGYHWENGKWKIHSLVNNLACNIIFKTIVSVVTGMKFDKKTCKFFKGAYVFDFDIDRIEHMWIKTQEYGRIMWRLESFSSAGLINCWEYETLVEPI